MSKQLTVSVMTLGEVRLSARLLPEEARWGTYVRGISAVEARALAAELLHAADEADQDPDAGLPRPDEETTT
ncbi:MAG: hypothetical protein HOY76_21395 [Streptomyces sp.]|jgi:hypothetical protein|nr:hypothetical protein [Streptomyces sp.]